MAAGARSVLGSSCPHPQALFCSGGCQDSGVVSGTSVPDPFNPHPARYRDGSQVLMVPPGSWLSTQPQASHSPRLTLDHTLSFLEQTGGKAWLQPTLLPGPEPTTLWNPISYKIGLRSEAQDCREASQESTASYLLPPVQTLGRCTESLGSRSVLDKAHQPYWGLTPVLDDNCLGSAAAVPCGRGVRSPTPLTVTRLAFVTGSRCLCAPCPHTLSDQDRSAPSGPMLRSSLCTCP